MTTVDLCACESCQKESPIETMTMMVDCWFCADCTAEFQATFDACDHSWTPERNANGDDGQYCEKCCGFVCDEDMPLVAPPATAGKEG